MPPSALINISHGMRLQEYSNRQSGLGASSPYPHSSYTERQPSNLSRVRPQGTTQVFRPSRSQPSFGKPRNAMETSEAGRPGHLPPRLANRGKVSLMTRGAEKSDTSNEFNQVWQELSDSSEARGNEAQKVPEQQWTAEGYHVDINKEPTQDGVLGDFGREEQMNSDWVTGDLPLLGSVDGDDVSPSNAMMAAIQGLSELELSGSSWQPGMEGGENGDEFSEVIEEESAVEEESASEKEKLPSNLVGMIGDNHYLSRSLSHSLTHTLRSHNLYIHCLSW